MSKNGLREYCQALTRQFDAIPENRKAALEQLGQYLAGSSGKEQPVRVTFICTHNSRRSQMAELWMRAAADWCGLSGVESFSGGTESTAFHPNAVAALQRAGFDIRRARAGEQAGNPVYEARLNETDPPASLFSKVYDAAANPQRNFAAVMVCSDADENCPFVPGADLRVSLPFEDPKHFDDTPGETKAYDVTCEMVGRELLYAASLARQFAE